MAQKSPLLLTGTGAIPWANENINQGTGNLQTQGKSTQKCIITQHKYFNIIKFFVLFDALYKVINLKLD